MTCSLDFGVPRPALRGYGHSGRLSLSVLLLSALEDSLRSTLDDLLCLLEAKVGVKAHVETYSEHALEAGSDSRAAAYVGIAGDDGKTVWGCGPREPHR